jgi:hypothetical protein
LVSRQVRFFLLLLSLFLASSAFFELDSDYLILLGAACDFIFSELKQVVNFDLALA